MQAHPLLGPFPLPPMTTVEDAFVAYRTTRDPAALAAVYDGTSSRLLAVALHLSGSSSAAEDAVQDTFLFALEHPERWDASRPLVPWLLGILTNLLKQSAYRARRAPDPERLQLPDTPEPESELEAAELLGQIESAITDLPQPYRTVVLLRLRNGLTPADIAVALDRKPSTVRAQLTRGVEMLRKVLPTAVAALLVGTAASAQGLSTAREVVMQRADELHRALQGHYAASALKSWAVRGVALLAGVVAIWSAAAMWGGDADVPVAGNPPAAPAPEALAADVQVHVAPLVLPEGDEAERRSVAAAGGLDVQVLRNGRGMPAARVMLEPVGLSPQIVVHNTSSGRGDWRDFESLRPCPPDAMRYRLTDAAGACAFEGLDPGYWICRSLGRSEVVRIAPGGRMRQSLHVEPECQLIRGLVLDPNGRAVANASVWVCREHRGRVRRHVLTTSESGRFTLAVAPFTTVGAAHDDHASVCFAVPRVPTAPPQDVVLQFREAPASVGGQVRDHEGRPVVGAVVEIGHACDTRVMPAPLRSSTVARPVRVVTDGAGRYSATSLVAGDTTVTVSASGFGTATGVVALRSGEPVSRDFELRRAATVTGLVRDGAGRPVPRATVRIGRRGGLGYRVAVTDEAGRYRLDDVTPGDQVVEVTNYAGGFAYRTVRCVAGQTHAFDATLTPDDLRLAGRILNGSGQPMAFAWILHRHRQGQRMHRLDARGRFSIVLSERDAAIPSSIRVFEATSAQAPPPTTEPRWIADDLRAGNRDVEIRIGAKPRTAFLRGVVRAPASGKLPSDLMLAREGQRWTRLPVELAADGSFQVGPLTAGRFELRASGYRRLFGPFELVDGQDLDVGELLADPSGSTVEAVRHTRQFALVFPEGESIAQRVLFEVRDAAGALVVQKHHRASLTTFSEPFVELPEGEYTVRASTRSGLQAERRFVIDAAVPASRALLLAF